MFKPGQVVQMKDLVDRCDVLEKLVDSLWERVIKLEVQNTLYVPTDSAKSFVCLSTHDEVPLKKAVWAIMEHLQLEMEVLPAQEERVSVTKKK